MHLKLVHPSTIIIAGPTGSGKTQFLYQLLACGHFAPFPQRLVWLYSEWQPVYDQIKLILPNTEFVNGLPTSGLYESFQSSICNMLVLDDQMASAGKNQDVVDLFTKGSHHRNLTVVYIVQNLYDQSKHMRTISLNAHYIILFKTTRDLSQVQRLGEQLCPRHSKCFLDMYYGATEMPHSYILVDLHPETPEWARYRSNILSPSGPTLYIPSNVASKVAHIRTAELGIKESDSSEPD